MAKLFTITETVQVGLEVINNEAGGHPLHTGLQRLVTRACNGLEQPEVRLLAADFDDGEGKDLWVTEKNEHDRRAIVLLRLVTYAGESALLLASTKQEELQSRAARVTRKYKPFEEAVGVELLLEQIMPTLDASLQIKEYLIELTPGAAFTIQRTGVRDGAPALRTVRWDGKWHLRNMVSWEEALNPHCYSLSMFVRGATQPPPRGRKKGQPAAGDETMPNFHAR